MINLTAFVMGLVAGLVAHDLAAQALNERPFRLLSGTCPECGTRRGWHIGTCLQCGRKISREIAVALVSGLVYLGLVEAVGFGIAAAAYWVFLTVSLTLVLTDLDDFRIVDRVNFPGTALGAVLLVITALNGAGGESLVRTVLAAGAYFLGTFIMFVAVRGQGFGFGDVKLSVLLGLFTGFISWGTLGWAVLLTSFIGGLMSLVVLAWAFWQRFADRRQGRHQSGRLKEAMKIEVPYGPAMVGGSWIAIVLAGLEVFPT